ncbi:MAG: undecaprenyl-diphosphate phosphatase, partial [Ruminococcaceae bacterium]|nr:undecaprenyl-diphosphate phosphatase [Oscillospiraceae bacterium]
MFFEIIKAVLIGLLEGITEWLPISSTGHMILFNELLTLKVSDEFFELFEVVIQLGAVLAVALLYFSRLNPLSRGKSREEKRATLSLLLKTV